MTNFRDIEKYEAVDIEYFDEIIRIIDKQYLGDVEELFQQSSFLELFDQDMNFVYHYHPSYWADFVLSQLKIDKNTAVKIRRSPLIEKSIKGLFLLVLKIE